MTWLHRQYKAEPLDAEEIQEFKDEGHADLLVTLEGAVYNSEDLYACDGCDEYFVESCELDENNHCQDCAREAQEAWEEEQSLRRWYQSMVL